MILLETTEEGAAKLQPSDRNHDGIRGSCKIPPGVLRISLEMFESIINTISWIGVKMSVCVSVTDVTSLPQRVLWERGYNVYRKATLGTSLNWCMPWSTLQCQA